MTITVGAFEARMRLSALLDRVAAGEDVVISRHGTPVARLIRAVANDRARVQQAIDELRRLRRTTRLDGLNWREQRDTGRR